MDTPIDPKSLPVDPKSLPATPVRDKVITAEQAIRLIRDGDTVVVGGFIGQGFAEELALALEKRFLETGAPRDLTVLFTVAQGDRQGRGLDRLCHPGLIKCVLGGHYALSPGLQKMAVAGDVEAYNLPMGVLSQLFRDTAGGRPGLVTRVGLDTFADPRHGGGKVNDRTTADLVSLMTIDGQTYLFYKAYERLDIAFLRGTTADPDGNITMEREAVTIDALQVATAVHNKGGLVIVQVERLADRGALNPRDVQIPGVLVDCVVLSSPEHHWQTWATAYSPAYSAELSRVPVSSIPPLPLDQRKIIARRAALELRPNSVVNLGIGIPEGVGSVAVEEHFFSYLTLTAESGVIGGFPVGGLDFGAAINAHAVIDEPAQFDFYDGGGLDAAFLGMAQADQHGNVNVSRFGPRLAGAGGFINISQNAKKLYFVGTFLAPCRTRVQDGQLVVDRGGVAAPKFLTDVEQRTFSGDYAVATGQPVLYVTERCVFQLTENGLQLLEIAPGIDLEQDVLAHLDFEPIIDGQPVLMDPRIFRDEPMGLREELLEMPLSARFSYDSDSNTFFVNLEGLAIHTAADIDALSTELESRLKAAGRPVQLVVDYDNFSLAPGLEDAYAAFQRRMVPYYSSIARYSTTSFMRLKLTEQFTRGGLPPSLYPSRTEAVAAGRERTQPGPETQV